MQQTLDIRFHYRDFNGRHAHCRLRVYEEPGEPPVVIATEVADNTGMSITNAAERVATQVWQLLERPQAGMFFVEHYPAREEKWLPRHEESFDQVTFTPTLRGFVNPHWRAMTREEVERLIGQPLSS